MAPAWPVLAAVITLASQSSCAGAGRRRTHRNPQLSTGCV